MTFIFFTVKLIFKLLEVLFLSSFKFLFAPPLAFKLGLTFFQTFLTTSVGGILGVLFFYYLSEGLIVLWRKYFSTIASWFISHPNRRNFPYLHLGSLRRNKKKVFTFRNRTLAKIHQLWFIGYHHFNACGFIHSFGFFFSCTLLLFSENTLFLRHICFCLVYHTIFGSCVFLIFKGIAII